MEINNGIYDVLSKQKTLIVEMIEHDIQFLKIVVFVVSVNKLVWMTSFMSCAMSHVYSLIELMTISIACHCGNGDELLNN